MRTIEMSAKVDEEGKMFLELPPDVLPGEYQIVMVLQEASPMVQPVKPPKPPLKLHIFEWEGWPKDATFSREELYDDVEY
ncbi:MAG: hypothetical protein WCS37_16930 [Chloroflexota bacterium]|nr:hypothetical protein [Chloroflexota bacterium]